MKRQFWNGLAVVVGFALAGSASVATAQTTRWGDIAMSPQFGSAELSLEKRLFEPGKDEVACMRCKHYVELRVGIDDQEIQGADFDITHFIAGYRYYAYVQMKEGPNGAMVDGSWAAYFGLGLGRYELDPGGDPVSGWSLRAGINRKVTEACKNGEPASWYMDWEVSATQHNLSLPGEFDYWSYQTGPRFVFPSRRDKERAEHLGICRQKTAG